MIQFDNSSAAFNPPNLDFEYNYLGAVLIFDDGVWDDIINNKIPTNPVQSKTGRIYDNFREYYQDDKSILLAYPNTGASAAVIDFELLIASGIKKFVAFGTCGVFNSEIPQNSIIVPTTAIREEGTSYHYLPADETVSFPDSFVEIMLKSAEDLGFVTSGGAIWTTDAVYRETIDKIDQMQAQGCIGVEMELSALMAVAKYRKVDFAEFLIVDDLVPPQRNITRKTVDRKSEKYLELALSILEKLQCN